MLNGLFLTMDHISLERWVEITWVSEHFQISANSLLSLILGLSLNINILMFDIKVTHHLVQKLKQFEWSLIVEFNERKVAHKWRAVETVHNLLDVCGG